MAYNYLKEAEYFRNSTLCYYDTAAAYHVAWMTNGNVEGWDSYSMVHTYGAWDGVLFGTSYGGDSYFSRTAYFYPVPGEYYYILRICMKIVPLYPDSTNITGGKVRWIRDGDEIWNSLKEATFSVYTDSKWHIYEINLGPQQWWQGNMRNLRIYPFLNSRNGDQYFVKYISIVSPIQYRCTNRTCSYYSSYVHPCPGVGNQGYCIAGAAVESVDFN